MKFMGCSRNKIVDGSCMIAKGIDSSLQAIREVWIVFFLSFGS